MEITALKIPDYVRRVIDAAGQGSGKGYLVGGCVRDALCGREPSDYDACVTVPADRLKDLFSGFRTVDTGLRFGTLTVISEGHPVEVTSCRCEGAYSDGRRPDGVEYTDSVEKDLARRDFTVNAMAYSDGDGLIDPFGGRYDLDAGVIRCVGEPRQRFGEDGLRILRAVRFASVLGFEIESGTADAVHSMREMLGCVSGERIKAELLKLLCGDNVLKILTDYSDVICTFIPELSPSVGFDQNNPHHIYTVYGHIVRTVDACPKDGILRMTMLLHDIAKPLMCTTDSDGICHFKGHPERGAEIAEEILKRLAFSHSETEEICHLIKYHDKRPEPTRKSVGRYLSQTGFDSAKKLISIRRADLSAQSPDYHGYFETLDETERIIAQLERENACVKISDLAIGGRELMAMGVPSGPEIGRILSELLEAVIDEECENTPEKLAQLAAALIK